jgi:hypothetical protein
MWTTGALSAAISACGADTTNGIDHIGYLINIDDIDKSATTVTNFAISALSYNPGAAAFLCTLMLNDDPETSARFQRGQYRDGWDHNFTAKLFVNDTTNRLRLDELLRSRLAVVYKCYYADGTSYWEIAGYELGLEVKDVERNYNDPETGGGWVVTLGCDDDFKEKDFPYILGTAPGTVVITAAEVETIEHKFTEAEVIAGVLTITTATAVAVPVAAMIIDAAGIANHYDIQRITDYQQRVNIGEKLKVGTYTAKVLYTQ